MNSLPVHNPQKADQQIDRALHILSTSQPVAQPGAADVSDAHAAFDAMNARLLLSLRYRDAAASSQLRRWAWRPRVALTLATLGAAYAVFLHLPTRKEVAPSIHQVANNASTPTPTQLASSHSRLAIGSSLKPASASQPASLASAKSSAATHASTASVDPAFLPSSPAPAAPLSHQEELLLSASRGQNSAMLAQLESQPPDPTRIEPPPDPDPLFAGFRPEPAETESQPIGDHGPKSPDATSTASSNTTPSDISNATLTEFRP